jgi:hypothetical protein
VVNAKHITKIAIFCLQKHRQGKGWQVGQAKELLGQGKGMAVIIPARCP